MNNAITRNSWYAISILSYVIATPINAGELPHFDLLKGKGVEVCDIYEDNLNAMETFDMICERPIISGYSEKLIKPEWAVLDIWDNRNLMALAQKFLDYGNIADNKKTVFDDQENIDATARSQVELKGTTMMTTSIDIDNDGVSEKVLRYQSGICGLAKYSYTTAFMVLNSANNTIDVTKSQVLYPDTRRNPNTNKVEPIRDCLYATYDIFSFSGHTYFDKLHHDGSLKLYRVEDGHSKELCRFEIAH